MLDQLDPAAVAADPAAGSAAARALMAGVVDQLARDGRPAADFWRVFGLRMMPVNTAIDEDLLLSLLPAMNGAEKAATVQAAVLAVRAHCAANWTG